MLLVSLALALPAAPLPQDPAWEPHRELAILYAGSPGGSRETVWVEFLKEWFDDVGVLPLPELSKATAADYDVVIADWRSHYGNDGYSKDRGDVSYPVLADDFDRPVIALDYVSSRIRPSGKLDWL